MQIRNKERMTSPRWWHRSYLIWLRFTRRTTKNYARIKHHSENLRTREWGWSTSCTTQTKTDWIQAWEEQLHADRMALSLGRHSTVPTAPPVAKENTAVTSSTASTGGHFMGTPTLVSPHGAHRSICGLNHWESDCDGETEEGLPTSSTRILADWAPACRAQRVNPSSSFALLQPIWWHSLTRELGGAQVCLIRVFQWGDPPALEPGLPTPSRRAES